jgi:hypothetical protein
MEIGRILRRVNLNWFTVSISGKPLRRYVVAFTNNTKRNLILLWAQIVDAQTSYDNVTLGWRIDHQMQLFVDVGTSTDSLDEARKLQKQHNQQAIRDTRKQEEIR